jgi:terminase, large subunit
MTLLPERKIKVPSWLPKARRVALAGRRITLRIPSGVRARLRTPEHIPPSEWNERFRVMPATETYPGRWRRDIAPHAAWIMDLWALPSVRDLWLCGPDQASKTSSMIGCIDWSIDQDPGDILYTASNEDKTKEIFNDKLVGSLRESPKLRKRLSRRSDDTGMCKVRTNHGVTIRAAWSNSPASTASFGSRYTFNDEVDKWHRIGKETSPIRRIKKRAKNYPLTHKHFWSSTPAGQYIYAGMMDCQQIFTHAARCPDCGELVVMDEEHLHIPDGATPESIKADPEQIVYLCNACDSPWDEEKRLQAYRTGDKYCIKGAEIANPVDTGVHLTGFVTPDMRMADIAITILQARAGDIDAKIDLAHGIKCINYKEEISERKEDSILRLRGRHAAGVVPLEADALEISIDTQDHGFWYRVRAWRYGLDLKSWLVKAGYVTSATPDDFSGLDEVLAGEYPDENGEPHRIMAGIIDAMGHRTTEVYTWSRRTGVLAAQGAQGRKTQPVSVSRIDRFPGNGRPIPGGLALYSIDTHYHKDHLANKLLIDPSDPGAFCLHSGYTRDQLVALERDPGQKLDHNLHEYAKQMCAEYRDTRNLWQCPEHKANHLWDCESNGLALVHWLGWQHAVSDKAKPQPPPPTKPQPQQADSRPGWFNHR